MKFLFYSAAFVCTVLVAFVSANNHVTSDAYKPSAQIEICTELTINEFSSADSDCRKIIAGPFQKINGAWVVSFHDPNSENFIGNLSFFQDNSVNWDSRGSDSRMLKAENFLIVPGSTVPVDVLPYHRLSGTDKPVSYEFVRDSGGRQFVDQVGVVCFTVDLQQAIENKWIRTSENNLSDLEMIKAYDLNSGKLLVKQLWEKNNSWWIFEQTSFRRSWRIR